MLVSLLAVKRAAKKESSRSSRGGTGVEGEDLRGLPLGLERVRALPDRVEVHEGVLEVPRHVHDLQAVAGPRLPGAAEAYGYSNVLLTFD